MSKVIKLFIILFIATQSFGQLAQFNLQRSLSQSANSAFTGAMNGSQLAIGTQFRPFFKNYYSLNNYIGYDQYVKKLHGGLGIEFNQSVIGNYETAGVNQVMINYAFHQHLTRKLKLSLGAGGGVSHKYQNFDFINEEGVFIKDTSLTGFTFNYKAGFILHTNNFYFGTQYYAGTSKETMTNFKEFGQLKLFTGIDLRIFKNKDLVLSPSLLYATQNGFQNLNLQLAFATPRFSAGINANFDRNIGIFGGVSFKQFDLKYQYAVSTSPLASTYGDFHELVFIYKFNRLTPAFFKPKLY